MADIATYKCSNQQCRLTLRLATDFPVWNESKEVITRHRSETFCNSCNKVVEYANDNTCTVCTSEVTIKNMGRACPRCRTGIFSMPRLSVF